MIHARAKKGQKRQENTTHRAVPGSDLEFVLVERLQFDIIAEDIAQGIDDGL